MSHSKSDRPSVEPLEGSGERDILDETATLYVLDELSTSERASFEAKLTNSPAAKAALRRAEQDLGDLLLSAVPTIPSAAAQKRLDESIAFASPFAALSSALAKLADLGEATMRELLTAVTDLARWEPGPGDGIQIFHLEGGPLTAGAVVGFVRIPVGKEFPEHVHMGDEEIIVMQGMLRDSFDNSLAQVGDRVRRESATTHAVRAEGDEDAIFLVVVDAGVTVDGDLIGPNDPRL